MDEKTIARFWAKVDKNGPVPEHMPHLGPCWVWTAGMFRRGYGAFSVGGKLLKAHRFSFAIASTSWPALVMHQCDNPSCVNPKHLKAGSYAENVADRDAKGRGASGARSGPALHPERMARGERHGSKTHPETVLRGSEHPFFRTDRFTGTRNPRCKITASQALEIRSSTGPYAVIASTYGVSKALVHAIRTRRVWKHI